MTRPDSITLDFDLPMPASQIVRMTKKKYGLSTLSAVDFIISDWGRTNKVGQIEPDKQSVTFYQIEQRLNKMDERLDLLSEQISFVPGVPSF